MLLIVISLDCGHLHTLLLALIFGTFCAKNSCSKLSPDDGPVLHYSSATTKFSRVSNACVDRRSRLTSLQSTMVPCTDGQTRSVGMRAVCNEASGCVLAELDLVGLSR